MQFALFAMACAALGWWIGSARKRARERERVRREIQHVEDTGIPSPDTAIGKRAKIVQEAQAHALREPPPVHGTARWGTSHDAGAMLAPDWSVHEPSYDLWLGELIEDDRDTQVPLVARYPGHLLSVAGTGQGKSVTQIVSNLLSYAGSVVVIDPKGELYDLTAARRRDFGPVYRLAPFAPEGESDCYNPLDELGDPRIRGARARQLAEMLVVRQGDKGASEAAFFENEAINLLTAIILAVAEWAQDKPDMGTLQEVRRICALPLLGDRKERNPKVKDYLEDVLLLMATAGKSAYVRSQGAAFAGYEPKLLGSFVSEINSNLAFFDGHPGFAEVSASSDFAFADLSQRTTTVYLTVPLKEMATSYRYLRAMIGCAFTAMEEQREAQTASVLFILDEFAALRDMAFMRDAVAQMRSSGAWFWFFVQDVAQLKGVYDNWSNVFLSQTDHQIFFGATADQDTKKHISTALGVGTMPYVDPNVSWSHSIGANDSDNTHPIQLPGRGQGRNVGQSINISSPVQLAARPLLTPFEVGTFLSQAGLETTHPTTSIIFSKAASGYPLKGRRRHWRDTTARAAPTVQRLTKAN